MEERIIFNPNEFTPVKSEDLGVRLPRASSRMSVAIIGGQDCGKSLLFDFLSSLSEQGDDTQVVLEEFKEIIITHKRTKIKILLLPDIDSLSTTSTDGKILIDELLSNKYDFILNVVDSTQLKRCLYFTTQLMDMGCHIVVALNRYDELKKSGGRFDHKQLSQMLDIPLIPTYTHCGKGIKDVLDMIVAKYNGELPHSHVESNHGNFIEVRVASIAKRLKRSPIEISVPRRYLALTLIEGNESLLSRVDGECAEMATLFRKDIEKEYNSNISQILADARCRYVAELLANTFAT